MPVIRDIQLSFLKVKEHTRSTETLQLASTSNYDEDISFGKETSCITSLYCRHMPKLRMEYEKGILIHCVDDISLLDEWGEENIEFSLNILMLLWNMGVWGISIFIRKREKELALQIVHAEMKRLAVKYDWDIEELEKVKNKILELNYRNEFVYIKKSSPNKKYVCNITCQHEVAYADVYLEIREYRTRRLIKKEKLIREEDMYKMFHHVSEVAWKLNHKVLLMNDKGKTVWMLTFLEKDIPANLVWKIERID
ncbi:Uncharacterized protein B5E38_3683 [Bacillus cereus]|nr:Uncharacterized protein B5E38_3683 [Bacillus cereus]